MFLGLRNIGSDWRPLRRLQLSLGGADHDLRGKEMPCLANGHGMIRQVYVPWRLAMIERWLEVSAACWSRFELICTI